MPHLRRRIDALNVVLGDAVRLGRQLRGLPSAGAPAGSAASGAPLVDLASITAEVKRLRTLYNSPAPHIENLL